MTCQRCTGPITDPELVVARLRFPIGLRAFDGLHRVLVDAYGSEDLVLVTDGPLVVQGWLTVARRPACTCDPVEGASGG